MYAPYPPCPTYHTCTYFTLGCYLLARREEDERLGLKVGAHESLDTLPYLPYLHLHLLYLGGYTCLHDEKKMSVLA